MVDTKVGAFIGLFVVIVVGLVLVTTLGDNVFNTSSIKESVNTSVTCSNDACVTGTTYLKDHDKIIASGWTINNDTNVTIGTNNYEVFTNGSIILNEGMVLISGQGSSPTLFLNYNYYDEQYVRDGVSRTLIALVVLLFVVGLFLMVGGKALGISPELFGKK